jgi:hypothetical protein
MFRILVLQTLLELELTRFGGRSVTYTKSLKV